MADWIAWARVAGLYDTYVQTQVDVPFFLAEAKKTAGPVLELMSGTGRVSLPLVEAGVLLTCVDNSAEMLAVLRSKMEPRGLAAPVHLMDVRELKLNRRFDLIIIPFHSFSELLTPEDREKALSSIYEHLSDTGRFICTLHNSRVRLRRVDGQLRLWGKYPLDNGAGLLLLWGQEELDADRHIVHLLEFFEGYDPHGLLQSKQVLELAYCPLRQDEFEKLARTAGFRIMNFYGDYTYSEFREETSPFMIWVLSK